MTIRSFEFWLPALCIGVLWADLVRQLGQHWTASAQYSYGWFVPALAAALLAHRWATRPDPQVAPGDGRWLPGMIGVILLGLVPLRLIHEVNPDWPAISWPLSLLVVVASLLVVRMYGGTGWVRHFAFPFAFMLVSVRWPWRIEYPLTQTLLTGVTISSVEILGWFGIPALREGNIIEVGSTSIGVTEACSGIRSLQASIMVSLFLGELYLLPLARRCFVLVLGLFSAVFLNQLRTLLLAWYAWSGGSQRIEAWHDHTGLAVLAVLLMALWFACARLARAHGPSSSGPSRMPVPRRMVSPRWLAWGLAGWTVGTVGATEAWFRPREAARSTSRDWSVVLPDRSATFQPIEVSAAERRMLGHDEQKCGAWTDPDGLEWIVYYFRWLPGSSVSRIQARGHSPARCIPAAGRSLVQESGVRNFGVEGLTFPMAQYEFLEDNKPLFAFFALLEDEFDGAPVGPNPTPRDRLDAVLRGKRKVGQRTFEIILRGASSLADAGQRVDRVLPGLIQLTGAARGEESTWE